MVRRFGQVERQLGIHHTQAEKKRNTLGLQTTLNPIQEGSKVGRNDPCPCGSGKKHKKCCL